MDLVPNKVLFVDDDADDLLLIHDILKDIHTDYIIEEAHNGREALEILQRNREAGALPCLIVLDINMPIMDGKETLVQIRRTEGLKDIPVVVFTTSKSDLDKMFFQQYQVEMITKPPSYHELEKVVRRLLLNCD